MRSLVWNGAGSACEAARLRASLALDGELDEIHLLLLQRHLDRCLACAELVPELRAVTEAVRRAPPERRLRRSVVPPLPVRRLPWARITVAVATLALGALTLPQLPASTGDRAGSPRLAAPPPRLPIGQRSALDDFLVAGRVTPGGADGSAASS